ncbi:TPA: peptide deformylase [Candidatus Saccharibacteria bacterium]|nr:peptide deformylase [Candidatus Saccharibacteria bacterium]HIO87956.1 peptide deformylase [Candidatus Saccharibacteria bacterium]
MEDGEKDKFSILEPSNPLLKKVTAEIIDYKSIAFKNALLQMQKIAGVIQDPTPGTKTMVGLAAPQIGWNARVILVDIDADPKAVNPTPNNIFMINPVITWASSNQAEDREGCFSLPGYGGVVKRSEAVEVRWHNEYGEVVINKFSGFVARIVQHEVDHLNGIRWFQRVFNPKHLHKVPDEEFQRYRDEWSRWDMPADSSQINLLINDT